MALTLILILAHLQKFRKKKNNGNFCIAASQPIVLILIRIMEDILEKIPNEIKVSATFVWQLLGRSSITGHHPNDHIPLTIIYKNE